MKTSNYRLAEIDFLRGIAVILVLFAHHWLFDVSEKTGWVGVDLFFVLSGFLVSGLLFGEYKKHGSVDAKRFLIRRGFKIYPSFYFSILVTTILVTFFPYVGLPLNGQVFPHSQFMFLNYKGILVKAAIECLFLQSYMFGFWVHHWSLAVEEHFYLFLVTLITFLIRSGWLTKRVFISISVTVFLLCLFMRIVTNLYSSDPIVPRMATHLRMDSLFTGVFISYFYSFHFEELREFYRKFNIWLKLSIIPLLSFLPFVDESQPFFRNTIGFSMIATAFCFLLLVFLFEDDVGQKVSKVIGKRMYGLIATKVGFYSYGIYLFHGYIVRYIVGADYAKQKYASGEWNYAQVVLSFSIYLLLSIGLGIAVSKMIETPMLRLRDVWFPRRGSTSLADHLAAPTQETAVG